MQTTVNLQENFINLVIPFIISICCIVGLTCYLIYIEKKKREPQTVKAKEIPEKNIKNIPVIKNKYLKQIDVIEQKYINKEIEVRKAYQLISETIRMFVFEITDITTQNYSLSEIKKLNIPKLYELIEEYYEPEFASKPKGNFESSINKARRVVNEWN